MPQAKLRPYFEAGVGVAYHFLGFQSGEIVMKDTSGAYPNYTYGNYKSKTKGINLLLLNTPYILVGLSY